MKLSTKLKTGAACGAVAAVAAAGAQAHTETFTLSVAFVDPFDIVEVAAGDFASLLAGANTTYSLSPAGVLTAGPGGGQADNTGLAAGNYTIEDESGLASTVDITVDNQQAGANTFITIDGFDCDYNTGTTTSGAACSFVGVANPDTNANGGTTLLIGYDITVANSPGDSATDTADYDITVTYN